MEHRGLGVNVVIFAECGAATMPGRIAVAQDSTRCRDIYIDIAHSLFLSSSLSIPISSSLKRKRVEEARMKPPPLKTPARMPEADIG
jgi:hypothetical protein